MRTFPASGVAMMLALAWGIACSPKLRVNLSGRTVDQVPVTQAGVSALPTGEAFEVEFVNYDGQTVALLTLEHTQVRPLQGGDIPHVRELASP